MKSSEVANSYVLCTLIKPVHCPCLLYFILTSLTVSLAATISGSVHDMAVETSLKLRHDRHCSFVVKTQHSCRRAPSFYVISVIRITVASQCFTNITPINNTPVTCMYPVSNTLYASLSDRSNYSEASLL